MYTAQINAHGNVIVCKGGEVRNSYRTVHSGSYQECLAFKVRAQAASKDDKARMANRYDASFDFC